MHLADNKQSTIQLREWNEYSYGIRIISIMRIVNSLLLGTFIFWDKKIRATK